MKDFLGRELKVGDIVIHGSHCYSGGPIKLVMGHITKFYTQTKFNEEVEMCSVDGCPGYHGRNLYKV